MDGGEKNIYQTLSFEIWMEERKTYTKHFHLRYGWRREKHMTMFDYVFLSSIHISNDNVWYMFFSPPSIQALSSEIWMEERKTYQALSFEIWMEERKTYTKHCHLRYGWRREKHIPSIFI
jgi:hypothetical protein